MYVEVTDNEGNADYAVGEITVMPDPVDGTIGGYDASEDDDERAVAKTAKTTQPPQRFLRPFCFSSGCRRKND